MKFFYKVKYISKIEECNNIFFLWDTSHFSNQFSEVLLFESYFFFYLQDSRTQEFI